MIFCQLSRATVNFCMLSTFVCQRVNFCVPRHARTTRERDRERERERERGRERERVCERERARVCVCERWSEREKEREREKGRYHGALLNHRYKAPVGEGECSRTPARCFWTSQPSKTPQRASTPSPTSLPRGWPALPMGWTAPPGSWPLLHLQVSPLGPPYCPRHSPAVGSYQHRALGAETARRFWIPLPSEKGTTTVLRTFA